MKKKIFCALMLGVHVSACTESSGSKYIASDQSLLEKSEGFIDAFYSFDSGRLEEHLLSDDESAAAMLYYQGWAEGGNYKVLHRKPCEVAEPNLIECSITVEDDPILALGIDFKVTDTFHISFAAGEISSIKTSSNDPQIYYQARDWVKLNHPDLIEIPCKKLFNGGPTPGECARAMTEGYAKFAASADFPER
ncbi:hypothetical protein [Biformimicrobium ophioploci]|nr:hypothetical protein [Microbulbifer sp. NKW57]